MRPEPSPQTRRPWVTRLPFFYGWVVLAVASFAGFMSGPGQTYGVSVFVDPIIRDLEWSRTTVSGMYTAGSLTAATAMVLVGRLLDRHGARVMLPTVGALFGLAAIWMSNVGQPVELFVGFALIRALGQGSLTLIPTTLVALWFIRLRGRATAIASLGMVASQAAFPPLINLLASSVGWRNAWVYLAFLIWGALLLPTVLLVRRSPEAVGLLPDGDPPAGTDSTRRSASTTAPEVQWTLGEAIRNRAFWLLIFAGSSQSLISTALVFHHVSLLGSRGVDPGTAALVLSVLAPTALVGTFVAGFLTDKYPNRYLLVAGQAVLAVAMLWTFVISSTWQALLYGGMLGLAGGLLLTTTTVIWPNYYGRAHLGSIRGAVTTSMVAFAALGPLPFGFLFDFTGSYAVPVFAFLALPAACGLAALLATPPQKPSPALV